MKAIFKHCISVWLSIHAIALAQTSTVYVDFGSSGLKTASPDSAGHHWNNVTELTPTGVPNLVSDAGQPTGISLQVAGTVIVNPFGTTVPDPSTLGGLAVPSATQDWFYVFDPNVITVTLGNLAPDGIYRLSLFGSRDSEETRVTRFDVVGMTAEVRRLTTSGLGIGISPQPNANRSGVSIVENLLPAADGTLTITVRRDVGPYGYLGALRLETMNVVNSPPAAIGVAASGAPRVGSNLTGRYSYWDKDGDPQGQTLFFWERAATPGSTPSRFVEPSTTAISCVPGASEQGQYVRMGVIPAATSGRSTGGISYSGWLGPVVSSATLTTFHVGSSFTLWPDIPRQLKELGQSTGQAVFPGVQLTAGRDLKFHWENGVDGGGYATGLPSRHELSTGSWDVLVLQPYNSEWFPWAVGQMRDYAQRYYTLADSNGAQVYLYCAWPWHSQPASTQNDINAAFEQVRAAISVGGNKPALIIPSGPALKAVIDACGTGTGPLSKLSREDFYRFREDPLDNLHLNNLGSYVSALTHYATIFKKSPVGLPARGLDAGFYNDNVVYFDQAVATRIQQIVWGVVGTYPNTGVIAPIIPPPPPPPPPVYVTHAASNNPGVVAYAFGPSNDGLNAPSENLPHPVAAAVSGKLALEYSINPDAEAAQVTYTPEWSTDLVNWTATQPTGFSQSRTGQKVTISWDRPEGTHFVRIYVVKPGT